jgi:hypothetical protein
MEDPDWVCGLLFSFLLNTACFVFISLYYPFDVWVLCIWIGDRFMVTHARAMDRDGSGGECTRIQILAVVPLCVWDEDA